MKTKIFTICLVGLLALVLPRPAFAAPANWANHVVISQIRIEGSTATDEFVELYNPTNFAVDLTGWKLKKKTSGGTESNLLTTFPTASIPAYGYFLIAHPTGYTLSVLADAKYSSASYSLANNNAALLYDSSLTLVDKVGWGTAVDFEGVAAASPASGSSILRKPADGNGNGVDSDNNSSDFVAGVSDPRNTASPSQPPLEEHVNTAPTLDWAVSAGYESDGVNPDSGGLESYTFKVKYTDADNDPPNYLKLYFDENLNGTFDPAEQLAMQEEDLQDTIYTDGKIYFLNVDIAAAGNYKYKFEASDGTEMAVGIPTLEKTGPQVTEENVVPEVELIGIEEDAIYEGEVNIAWEIEDQNTGQTHTVDLYYSKDGGTTWLPIVTGISGTSYTWVVSNLASGNYKIKIRVTDSGSPPKSAEGLSPPFVIQNVAAGDILINEVLFDPSETGIDTLYEWVEFYNPRDYAIQISGWKICDKTECDALPQISMLAKTYHILNATDLADKSIGNGLSNSGDSLTLISATGVQVSVSSWDKAAPNNLSWARKDDGSWVFSTHNTPGSANDFSQEEGGTGGGDEETQQPTPNVTQTTLEEVRSLPLGTQVSLEGTVSVEPGKLGDQIFYIQGSPGLQIYNYSGDFPTLHEGDRVRVVGEISSASGELRIKTSELSGVVVIGSGQNLEVISVETGSIDDSWEGHLVLVEGTVVQDSGDTFYIDDGSGTVKIYIKDSTNISINVKKGDKVQVRGIVSQTSSGYRVMPRRLADIVIMEAFVKMPTPKVAKAAAVKAATSTKKPTATKTPKIVAQKNDSVADKVLEKSQNVWNLVGLIALIAVLGGVWWFFFRKTPDESHEGS